MKYRCKRTLILGLCLSLLLGTVPAMGEEPETTVPELSTEAVDNSSLPDESALEDTNAPVDPALIFSPGEIIPTSASPLPEDGAPPAEGARSEEQPPETEPVVNSEAVPEAEPVTEPETVPETEPVTEPATAPETEPVTEPATAPETEPVTEPETEPVTEPETDPVTEPETEPEPVFRLTANCGLSVSVASDTGFPADTVLSAQLLSDASSDFIRTQILGLSDEETGFAVDLTLLRQGISWFPQGNQVEVTLEMPEDVVSPKVYHLPGDAEIGLMSAESGVPTPVEARLENGKLIFTTDGFSTFYILKGTARPGEAENRVVSVNAGTNNTYYAAPGSTLILRRSSSSPHWRFTQTSGQISATVSGASLGTGWVSGQDAVLTVAPDAQPGEQAVLQSGRGSTGRETGSITVIVMSQKDLIDRILGSTDYPLYLTVIANSTRIPGEPSVAEGGAWRFVQPNYASVTTRVSPFASSGAGWIPENISDFINFTNSVDGTNTMGVADATGARTLSALENAATAIDYEKMMRLIWNDTQRASSTVFGDGVVMSDYRSGHTLEDFLREYRIFPYVVKIQTGYSLGWHIDCCIVRRDQVRVNYDLNLPAGSVFSSGNIKTPSGVSVNLGESVTVDPGNQSGLKVDSSYPVTASDGKEYTYTFLGWYPAPTGEGHVYITGDLLYPQQDMTLYARWTSPQEILYPATALAGEGIAAVSGTGDYPYQALVEFSAQVSPGWEFTGWFDGDTLVSDTPEYAFRMPRQSVTLEARAIRKTVTLTLKKSGMRPGESALFLVSWPGGSLTVVLGSGEQVTVSGIPTGVLCTVTEQGQWSWCYTPQSQSLELTEDSTLSFVNTPISTPWRYGEDRCRNQFR